MGRGARPTLLSEIGALPSEPSGGSLAAPRTGQFSTRARRSRATLDKARVAARPAVTPYLLSISSASSTCASASARRRPSASWCLGRKRPAAAAGETSTGLCAASVASSGIAPQPSRDAPKKELPGLLRRERSLLLGASLEAFCSAEFAADIRGRAEHAGKQAATSMSRTCHAGCASFDRVFAHACPGATGACNFFTHIRVLLA